MGRDEKEGSRLGGRDGKGGGNMLSELCFVLPVELCLVC